MAILLYEDHVASQLAPVTLTRPAFAISCGGTRLIDEILALGERVYLAVRPHLREIVEADYPEATVITSSPIAEAAVCVNGRLVPTVDAIKKLRAQLTNDTQNASNTVHRLDAGETLDPARLPPPRRSDDCEVFDYPHDIVRYHLSALPGRLEQLITEGSWRQPADGVYLAEDVKLTPTVEFDTTEGPIVIRSGAAVGPFAYLQGPLLIDEGAKVLPHAQVKDTCHIGNFCKVGGELEGSVLEPYSNKQHHGFLGHAYVGSWVNLGAGTTNSDLKNTYGQINIDYGQGKVATQMQFMGCVLGDYVKTAINTSIYTGKTIGVASMLYGTVTRNIPSFVNYVNDLGSESAIAAEVIITMQQRMFARRQVDQRDCDQQLIQAVYELTAAQRAKITVGPPAF